MLFIHEPSARYPVGETEVRFRLHGTELPLTTDENSFREHGYVGVATSPKPVSQEGFSIREDKPEKLEDGSYIQRWKLIEIDYTIPENRAAAAIRIQKAVGESLNLRAQQLGYDGIESAVSYAISKHPEWRLEGCAFRDWRDAVWLHAFPLLDAIKSGNRPVPMQHDFISSLPELAVVKP